MSFADVAWEQVDHWQAQEGMTPTRAMDALDDHGECTDNGVGDTLDIEPTWGDVYNAIKKLLTLGIVQHSARGVADAVPVDVRPR